MNVCDIWRHPHLMKTSGWYECKFSWDRIMKGIEIFVLKSFGIVYVCVNVIKIHNFNPKPTCDLHLLIL